MSLRRRLEALAFTASHGERCLRRVEEAMARGAWEKAEIALLAAHETLRADDPQRRGRFAFAQLRIGLHRCDLNALDAACRTLASLDASQRPPLSSGSLARLLQPLPPRDPSLPIVAGFIPTLVGHTPEAFYLSGRLLAAHTLALRDHDRPHQALATEATLAFEHAASLDQTRAATPLTELAALLLSLEDIQGARRALSSTTPLPSPRGRLIHALTYLDDPRPLHRVRALDDLLALANTPSRDRARALLCQRLATLTPLNTSPLERDRLRASCRQLLSAPDRDRALPVLDMLAVDDPDARFLAWFHVLDALEGDDAAHAHRYRHVVRALLSGVPIGDLRDHIDPLPLPTRRPFGLALRLLHHATHADTPRDLLDTLDHLNASSAAPALLKLSHLMLPALIDAWPALPEETRVAARDALTRWLDASPNLTEALPLSEALLGIGEVGIAASLWLRARREAPTQVDPARGVKLLLCAARQALDANERTDALGYLREARALDTAVNTAVNTAADTANTDANTDSNA